MGSGIFGSLGISASGMSAQRARMDMIAANIANKDTTRTAEGGPYKAQHVTFQSQLAANGRPSGVAVSSIVEDNNFRTEYQPDHPDADATGYVRLPNVDVVSEFSDLLAAQRSYQLGSNVVQATRSMLNRALDLLSNR